jgi:hypothetical protein
MAELRERPVDAAEQVAALPRRVAHATYALLAWGRDHPYGPHRPGDVVLYDAEAPSASSTSGALCRAMRNHGLVDRWGRGLFTPTLLGQDLFPALEARFLAETELDWFKQYGDEIARAEKAEPANLSGTTRGGQ